jgi:nuclear polyadenylated RNA-binding protein 3
MQHDVGFNQTEAHMNDPAAHNTEVRPDLWRDPNEEPDEAAATAQQPASTQMSDAPLDHVTPYSTGADIEAPLEPSINGIPDAQAHAEQNTDNMQTSTTDLAASADPSPTEDAPIQLSTISAEPIHDQSNGGAGAFITSTSATEPSSDPSVPAADPASIAAGTLDSSIPGHDQALSSAITAPAFNPNAVDVQALLETLKPTPSATAHISPQADGLTVATTDSTLLQSPSAQPETSSLLSPTAASGLGATGTALPPRPPPQEQPIIHPNYVHSQHIRDYHPHATNPAFQPHGRTGSQGNIADANTRNFVPPVPSPGSANAAGPTPQTQSTATPTYGNGHSAQTLYSATAPFAASPTSSLPPTYGQYPGALGYPTTTNQTGGDVRSGEQRRPEDRQWDAEVQRKYDRFIEEERKYVSEGRWEQFPNGARLFVGKLSFLYFCICIAL